MAKRTPAHLRPTKPLPASKKHVNKATPKKRRAYNQDRQLHESIAKALAALRPPPEPPKPEAPKKRPNLIGQYHLEAKERATQELAGTPFEVTDWYQWEWC